MKKIIFTICLLAISTIVFGQSTNNLPKFSNNPLLYNPAYAGSTGTLDASISHNTMSSIIGIGNHFSVLSVSAPIGKGNWNIGGNLMHDETFSVDFTSIDGIVAYHKNLNNGSKLSFGAMTSLEKYHLNPTLRMGFITAVNTIAYRPEVGLGGMYESKRGYLSISAPDILALPWTYQSSNGLKSTGYSKRDLYISGGLNFEVFSGKLQILPSAIYHKTSTLTVFEVLNHNLDINASFVLFEKLWIGSGYKTNISNLGFGSVDAINASVGYNLKNGLRVSAQLEWATTELMNLNNRAIGGIMLGYRMLKNNDNLSFGRRNFF